MKILLHGTQTEPEIQKVALNDKNFVEKNSDLEPSVIFGAKTISITTFSTMTFSIVTFSITIFSTNCWVSFMLSIFNAEYLLCWVSFMLSIFYAEYLLCWVSFMLSIFYADCRLIKPIIIMLHVQGYGCLCLNWILSEWSALRYPTNRLDCWPCPQIFD